MGSSLILIVQILCLALWIGGSAAILLIVTPEIFRGLSDRTHAGAIAGAILIRFREAVLLSVVVLGITIWIQIIGLGSSIALKLRLVLMLISLSVMIEVYIRFVVTNRMRRMLTEPAGVDAGVEFVRLQRRSMHSFLVNLFLGIAVVTALIVPF